MVTGDVRPFNSDSSKSLQRFRTAVSNGERPTFDHPSFANAPAELALILSKCWHKDPDSRPAAREVMRVFDDMTRSYGQQGSHNTGSSLQSDNSSLKGSGEYRSLLAVLSKAEDRDSKAERDSRIARLAPFPQEPDKCPDEDTNSVELKTTASVSMGHD